MTGFTNFSEQLVLDAEPTGWTKRWSDIDPSASVEAVVRVVKAASLGEKVLLIDTNSDGFSGSFKGVVSWDVAQIGPDYEILALMRGHQTNGYGLATMGPEAPSGSPLKYTAPYSVGASSTAQLTNATLRATHKTVDTTSYGVGASANSGVALPDMGRYFMRVRRNGKRIRAKLWLVGVAEPAGWMLDSTEVTFLATGAGFAGLHHVGFTGHVQGRIICEYLSISGNPEVTGAPLPAVTDLMGGNYGQVNMAVATLAADQFVHYPVAGALAPVFEARPGALHGRALKFLWAAGTVRGFVNWVPAGMFIDGDVLSLVEVNGVLCGPGRAWPKLPTGAVYDFAYRDFALMRHASDRLDWCAVKSKNSEVGWPARGNTGVTTGVVAPAERWWIRHRKTGRNCKIRAWKFGVAEPGTWNLDVTAAGNDEWDVVGLPSFGYEMSAAATIYLEHLAWTDDIVNHPISVPS
jgi:hypothetical protein